MKSAIFARLFRIPFSTMKESVKEVPNFLVSVPPSIVWQHGDSRCLHGRFNGAVYSCAFLLGLCFLAATFCVGKHPNYACLSL